MMSVLRGLQESGIHWYFLHSADGFHTGCGFLFCRGRWTCGFSVRLRKTAEAFALLSGLLGYYTVANLMC